MATTPHVKRPWVLLIGDNEPELKLFQTLIEQTSLPVMTCRSGLEAWKFLARNQVALIILTPTGGPLSTMEFLVLLRNDNEFVKIPLLINGRLFTNTEQVFLRNLGYPLWITPSMTDPQIKECIEKLYGKAHLVIGFLASSHFIELKLRKILFGCNALLKTSYTSQEFLRRLETSQPEMLLIDLRFRSDGIEQILKSVTAEEEWGSIPRLGVAPANHLMIKPANQMGLTQFFDEELPRAEARKILQLNCKKAFFDLPFPQLSEANLDENQLLVRAS